MPNFAKQVDAIPVVLTTAQRAVLFPSPELNQRVQNLETGAIERWTNGAWTADYDVYSFGGAVNVKTYGAVGDDATNDTAAIQAAIDAAGAGGTLIFPEGIYRCVGLTSSANAQQWIGLGQVILKKNGNGVILAHDGDDFFAQNIQFRGESATPTHTGNNLNLTGNNPKLLMCGSRYAYARAVLATGNHVQILGTNDIYQTTDATASGYDIEIGVSGTATLYHQVQGIYTSQSTGGIKFIDCGSQSVIGGQFGKYTVAAGASPAGVNGGLLTGARVLGAIAIDISNSVVVGNQFGAVSCTYGAGTSGHKFLGNVEQAGFTLVNNGNNSEDIVRQVGSSGVVEMRYGADASLAVMKANIGSGLFTFPQVEIPNNVNYRAMRASPNQTSTAWTLGASASDNLSLAVQVGSNQQSVASGQQHQFLVNSVEKLRVGASGIYPGGTTSFITQGAGTPEGAVTAVVGCLYLRTDGGAGTSIYVKESGTGNTGWVAK